MKKRLVTLTCLLSMNVFAAPTGEWFVRPYVGVSQMADTDGQALAVDNLNGLASVSLDAGFNAGLGIGYQYTENISVELAWEYRSNPATTDVANASEFNDGNYASNAFFINSAYTFNQNTKWAPYVGVGLGWLQEVDIDLERNGVELSYSGSNGLGYQVFTGINYELNPSLNLQFEIRFTDFQDNDLESEGEMGSISSIAYQPNTAQIGLVYTF